MTARTLQLPLLPEHCYCDDGCGESARCHLEGYGVEPYCLCSGPLHFAAKGV